MEIDEVRRRIRAHELAAERANSTTKAAQHRMAAQLFRETFDLPTPVSFGRDSHTGHRQAMQRAERAATRSYTQRK